VILCDTGPLVAAFNQADSDHTRCTEFLALAERLDLNEVAALDRRGFQVVAPRHLAKGQRFRLLPE
jgi:hypothetical protein